MGEIFKIHSWKTLRFIIARDNDPHTIFLEHTRFGGCRIFGFDGDLYGKQIEVALFHKIRNEKKFSSLQLLKQQIELDAEVARVWLLECMG